ELGIEGPDVADEMNHAECSRLQRVGVRANDGRQLVGSRMLERADRKQLVVLAGHFAKVAFDDANPVGELLPDDLLVQFPDLLGRRIDAGTERAVSMPGMKKQAAPSAPDVDECLARFQSDLPAYVVHLVLLRFLEGARAVL